jgi:hypothetical protein
VTFVEWRVGLLAGLELRPTPARMRFLAAWAECEGGHAEFNPLNTTMRLPGSSNYNSVGVQNYRDAAQGLAATLLTLRLDYYSDIRSALKSRSLTPLGMARRSRGGLATWGTGSTCIERVLRG